MPASFPARPPWQAAPAVVHRAVERCAGDVVVGARDVAGGMSPGPAAILSLRGGGQVFAKAVSKAVSPGSYRLYEQEVDVLAVVPAEVPAPRLLGCAEAGGWIVLVMEAMPGRTAGPPWTTPSVQAAARACAALADVAAPAGVPPVDQRWTGRAWPPT